MQLGEPRWTLALFAAVVTPLGIWLWDGIAPQLGIGPGARPVSLKQTLAVWGVLATIVVLELVVA
ncbi:hypothetical protein [Planctomicrobium piriforme]|uniref:Uncharacterized protein n=1 Tax=Planctomicrobium piriforme TaxID=1576369 RepID=A0A1I3GPL2_9PLAN|nr:hypothetical protein [Planctomicrobium piriforme]SFI25279.1 hypothetical protein SAMN05421753_10777 [Planctomicrobium piriforme]